MNLNAWGAEALADMMADMPLTVDRVSPVCFNEERRYLSAAATAIPGPILFSVTLFMRKRGVYPTWSSA